MEPIHINCKSGAWQRKRKRCAPPLIRSSGIHGSLSIRLHYFHCFLWISVCLCLLKVFPLASWTSSLLSEFFLRLFLTVRFSQMCFFFLFLGPHCTFLSLINTPFSLHLFLSGSMRELAYTIDISWQHAASSPGPGQLWGLHLLSRCSRSIQVCVMQPKPTIQQEQSNLGRVKNCLTEALFTFNRVKQTNQNATHAVKELLPKTSEEESPNIKISVNFTRKNFTQHSKLFTFFWSTAAKDAHGQTLPKQNSLFQEKKKKMF